MPRLRKTCKILLPLLLLALIAGCAQKAEEPQKTPGTPEAPEAIRIGLVAPLTGPASTTGNDMLEAAELAIEEINAQGGVYVKEYNKKLPLKLYRGDTETSTQGGVKAVTKLITEDRVHVLVGGFSSSITYADQVVAAEHRMPFIITGASSPLITRRTDIDTSTFFHHCPTTDDYSEATMLFVDQVIRPAINKKFGFSDDRKLRLAVVYQEGKYGEGVLEGVKKAIEKHNLKITLVAEEKFKRGESDFRTILTAVKAAKPDVVYPATFLNEQVPLVTQGRRDVGLNTIYLAVEATDDPDYYRDVGEWGDYSIQESRFSPYTTPPTPVGERAKRFKEAFYAKYGDYPSMMGASTYEGVYIAAKAIELAGSLDKAKIVEALNQLEMEEIVEPMKDGKIKFSEDYRESKFELYMQQLRYNPEIGEPRPVIVWPEHLKEADFELPPWYEPGPP
ncbi:ABC transporter substrate-binding protein [Candidatus Pyrohabitans sp.]